MFRKIFVRLAGRRRRAPEVRRPTYRPHLDALELRLAPATLFKIVATPTSGIPNTFTSLSAAVAVAQNGDSIEILAGANPGGATITQSNLTLIGDPTAAPQSLQASGAQVGSLVLFGNNDIVANLAVSSITIGAGSTGEVINNCVFNGKGVTQTPGSTSSFTPDGGNTVQGCTFLTGAGIHLGNTGGSAFATAANDIITNNVFWNPGANAIVVQNETAGLQVLNNRINHNDPTSGTAFIMAVDCVGTVSNNIISANALSGAVGILVRDFNVIDTQTTNLTVANNVVTTNQTGIEVQRFSSTNTFSVTLQGNTLAGNLMGLVLTGNSAGAGSDYGTLAILNNDFRGFSGQGANFAILCIDNSFYPAVAPATPNKLTGQNNIFSVTNPQSVVSTASAPGTTINFTTTLTPSQYNLLAMFQTLGAGSPTAAQFSSVGTAATLPLTQAKVAVYSMQAATVMVDALYVSLLGRAPGGGEDKGWASVLAAGSMTKEQLIISFLSSTEYYGKVTAGSASPNGAWVQALYVTLLGRQATGPEVNAWASTIPGQGLAWVVGNFVHSFEYRYGQVSAMYGTGGIGTVFAPNILKRKGPPSVVEVSGWVNTGLDLQTIEAYLVSSVEFSMNG
jgi:hypothetical protein